MGELLYTEYLEWMKKDQGIILSEFILESGLEGLLWSFEGWLLEHKYLKIGGDAQYVKQ